MSDCGVCIGAEAEDGSPEFYEAAYHTARKEHICGECRRVIAKGSRYEYASGKFDGDFFAFKTCLDCEAIRNAFNCGSAILHGELWQQMRDYGFEQMTTGCLAKIETASAKAYLIERWQKWKGLAT